MFGLEPSSSDAKITKYYHDDFENKCFCSQLKGLERHFLFGPVSKSHFQFADV
jgi:hypothetical protein